MSFFQKINNAKFTGDWLIDGKTYSLEDKVKPLLEAGAFSVTLGDAEKPLVGSVALKAGSGCSITHQDNTITISVNALQPEHNTDPNAHKDIRENVAALADGKADKNDLADVAFTGDYNDLRNVPKGLFDLYKAYNGELTTPEDFFKRLVELIDAKVPVIVPGTIYYGYIQNAGVHRIADITADMITSAATMHKDELNANSYEVSLPEGAMFVVAVEAGKGFKALQDDGVDGMCIFDENIGEHGTGANGIPLTIEGKEYLLYGEFVLVDCDAKVHVVRDY